MPWGGTGGQNIEHPHTRAILSSFFVVASNAFYFFYWQGTVQASYGVLRQLLFNKNIFFKGSLKILCNLLFSNSFTVYPWHQEVIC